MFVFRLLLVIAFLFTLTAGQSQTSSPSSSTPAVGRSSSALGSSSSASLSAPSSSAPLNPSSLSSAAAVSSAAASSPASAVSSVSAVSALSSSNALLSSALSTAGVSSSAGGAVSPNSTSSSTGGAGGAVNSSSTGGVVLGASSSSAAGNRTAGLSSSPLGSSSAVNVSVLSSSASLSASSASAASAVASSSSASGVSGGGGGGVIGGGSSSGGSASSSNASSCVNAGYDLSALTGSDLFFNGTGNAAGTGTVYSWAIRPCGTVSTAGYCTGQAGEFCQGSTTVSAMNVTAAGVGSGAIWGQISLNGQYGVAQFLQDGTSCGSSVGDREGTIVYLCNATATTPFIASIIETTTCHYQAIIQTSAICSQVPSTGFSTSTGTSIISTSCGGGIYDLSTINNNDIVGYSNGNYWGIRVCGNVALQNCSGTANVSVCQFGAGYGYVVAQYTPQVVPTFYQYLAPGVVSQIIQDGAACGSQMRLSNVTFYCNATATTPYFSNANEYVSCHYQLSVQTAATCGTAFLGAASPSSSSAAAVVSRSSSAAATSVVITPTSTTTGTAVSPTSTQGLRSSSSAATSPVVVPATAQTSSARATSTPATVASFPSSSLTSPLYNPTAASSSSYTSVPIVTANPPVGASGAELSSPLSTLLVAVCTVTAAALLFA